MPKAYKLNRHTLGNMTLYIRADNSELRDMIQKQIENHRWTDSGFDIPMVAKNFDMSMQLHGFYLGINVAATLSDGTPAPCLLLPRSSIYKSAFRLCNSIGLIDAGYRGEVKAMVDNLYKQEETTSRFEDGVRLFQICQHNFLPWSRIVLTDELPAPPDNRGSGGFGSTGLQLENHPRT
jgi:dUTP pyrophosphatase